MKTPQTSFKFTALSEKEAKNLSILELIRKKGPLSRTEISKIVGINIVSTSNYVNHYIDRKIVLEKGFDISSGGRKPELVELNKTANYVIGIEVAVDEIRTVLTDLGTNVIEKVALQSPGRDSTDTVAKSIEMMIGALKKHKIPRESLRIIGIGLPDDNLGFTSGFVTERFGIETFVSPSAVCAAFGERQLNNDADAESLLYVYSDLGHAVVIKNGEKISEDDSAVYPEESKYLRPWGKYFEIAQTANREVAKGVGTKIVEVAGGRSDNITEEVVIEAAKRNDEIAQDIIRNVGLNLGLRIAYLINLFSPQVVIIGRGVEKGGEMILDPIKKMVKRFAFTVQANRVKILSGVLSDDAVSLGAASLATREIFLKA